MNSILTFFLLFVIFFQVSSAQQAQFPVIKDFGGIYEIPSATMVPDAKLDYHIIIDVFSGPESADQINPALNNVARMINLHALGGVPPAQIDVVLAIHGDATVAVLNDDAYRERFQMANPNLPLIEALSKAGVRLTVCGQSLLGRKIDVKEVTDQIEIALSMLTTVTTHQLKGYAFLRF
ncbi:MAG: DsrE family protein [Saprospiraceae bacterium]|nr:DsrE family protein [Saprospiraceae bacterium]